MSEEKPVFQVDDDWKKQAQEEKRRLEEEEKKRAAAQQQAAAPAGAVAGVQEPGPAGGGEARGRRGRQQLAPASIQTLVHSVVTQALYYLGELSTAGGDSAMNMDMAKHQLDTLAMLEAKTQGNLSPEEKEYFDVAMYEARMRFISVAGQIIAGA